MSFAKIVPSMFTGSMRGAGAMVIATWTYALAHCRLDHGSTVELFPRTVAEAIGESTEDVISAINVLCSPDPMSRTCGHDGSRLVRTTTLITPIPFAPNPHANLYHIPSYEKYSLSNSRSSEYWTITKRRQREKKRLSTRNTLKQTDPNPHNNGHLQLDSPSKCPQMSNMSTQDTDADAVYPPVTFSVQGAQGVRGIPLPENTSPKLDTAVRISYEKELSRADSRLKDLRSHYDKPYPPPILSEIKSIKARSAHLKKQLGAVF